MICGRIYLLVSEKALFGGSRDGRRLYERTGYDPPTSVDSIVRCLVHVVSGLVSALVQILPGSVNRCAGGSQHVVSPDNFWRHVALLVRVRREDS